MKIKPETLKNFFAALIIIVCLGGGITFAYFTGALEYLELKLFDFRANLFASGKKASDEIIVILLDQDSIDWGYRERGWGWPWPRSAYAELTDYMNLGNAKAITFDVLFTEPSIHGAAGSFGAANSDDAIFVRASSDYGKVVQIVTFSTQAGGNTEFWPRNLNKPLFELHNFESIIAQYEQLNQNVETTGTIRALFPINELRETAGIIGSATGWGDSDGIFRRNNLFSIFDGKAVPGLAAASLIVSGESNQITFNEKKNVIEWGDWVIPVDKHGRSILRFRGELDNYHPYWAWEVLQSAENLRNGREPVFYPEDFENRYVFFGFYAQGLFDIVGNPITSMYPGVGMHITMLDNILARDFIRESSGLINALLIIVSVIIIVILALYSGKVFISVGGTTLVFVTLLGSALVSYNNFSLWIPMAAPLLAVLLAFITTSVYNYATEGRKKRFIKSAFSQYLSPAVIENIIADPSKLNLGGETRDMTAIFTDIQKFSSISESLQKEYSENGPRALVNLLNLYLTEMSNIILDNGGTIDKYEGDAIIAFFGAPIHFNNHASLACRATIQMKKAEAEINREALALGLITPEVMQAMTKKGVISSVDDPNPIFTRLGINTGDMVVGNMGTPNKMDYTIMGNAVNLAARLEGVNKQYDTGGILISEYTRSHIGDEFVIRPLSRVRVVGINTPLRLYELLDIASEAPPELLNMVKNWEEAFKLYENKEFKAAEDIFQGICGKNEKDMAARKYLNRCIKFQSSPPDDKTWDNGVDNLTEK